MAQCARPKGFPPSGPAKSNGDNNRSKKKRENKDRSSTPGHIFIFIFLSHTTQSSTGPPHKKTQRGSLLVALWVRCKLCSGKTKRKAKSEKAKCWPIFIKLDCTPDEDQARRGLELPLRGFIASTSTHPRSPTRLISATSTGSTSTSMIRRALRVQDARLFEVFAFRA